MDNQGRQKLPPGVTPEDVANDPYGRTADQIYALKQQGGPVDNSYVFGLRERLRNGDTFKPDEVPAIRAALDAAMTNARLSTSGAGSLAGQRDAEGWALTLRQVLARAQGQSLGAGASAVESAPAAPAATPTGGSRTVNINLAGLGSTSINVASDADAAKVEAVMRQIETAMARAGG
jgi:hypothetical protein